MKHYHNTTEEQADLFAYEQKAQSQDEQVFCFMKGLPSCEFTCEEINEAVLPDAPLTSARRALSNLFKRGLIEKVRKVTGSYGRPIYVWRLK